MLKRGLPLLVAGCFLASAIWAAEDPFVGEWKLNPSKSRFPDEMKVESAGANKYAFDFGGGTAETIVADGTDQPGLAGTTLSVTVEGPDSWKVVRKKDGRILLTANWELSKDGNTLRDDYTEFGPNGASSNVKYVYARTAGTSGFAGTWESTSEQLSSVLVLRIRAYEGDGLTFINPEQTKSVKFDGKDYPHQGPNAEPGSVSSGRRVNERTLEIIDKVNGKTRATEWVELSPDHKTLTMTVQPAGRGKPNIFVFDRE
ncbi:MAG TPA: hypothetical protein VJN92_11385 [Candidatus Acidoferrum sp.]|nr:hypothetical protein [Candidatus Acidoferrum sp.]